MISLDTIFYTKIDNQLSRAKGYLEFQYFTGFFLFYFPAEIAVSRELLV